MPAISPGIPINYLCILMLFIAIYSILKYNIFSLQLGSKSFCACTTTLEFLGGCDVCKTGHGVDEAHWCRKGAPETQDLQARQCCRATWKYDEHNPSRRDFWKILKVYVTWASAWTRWITCTSEIFRAVWGLSTDSLPAWKQLVDKNNDVKPREVSR